MLFANVSSLFLPVLSPKTHSRFKLAVVNDCREVSPLFGWQAYYRRQHLSRSLGVAVQRCRILSVHLILFFNLFDPGEKGFRDRGEIFSLFYSGLKVFWNSF